MSVSNPWEHHEYHSFTFLCCSQVLTCLSALLQRYRDIIGPFSQSFPFFFSFLLFLHDFFLGSCLIAVCVHSTSMWFFQQCLKEMCELLSVAQSDYFFF